MASLPSQIAFLPILAFSLERMICGEVLPCYRLARQSGASDRAQYAGHPDE